MQYSINRLEKFYNLQYWSDKQCRSWESRGLLFTLPTEHYNIYIADNKDMFPSEV